MAIQAQLYSDNIGFPSCGSLDWIDSHNNNNGCGGVAAGFNQYGLSVQQQLEQFQHHLQNHHQGPRLESSMVLRRNSMMGSSQFEKQRHEIEIDQFIKSQNERLRLLLQEQRKQQLSVLVKKMESRACVLLRQKDEEISKAEYKAMELQNLLKKLEMENQAWQRVAQENEAMVVSLNNTLEQVREQGYRRFDNAVDDAESCCECEGNNQETEENREKPTSMVCKGCYCRSSCVLFLPCRHLCSCKECADFLDSCPVCRTAKKASIEALVP